MEKTNTNCFLFSVTVILVLFMLFFMASKANKMNERNITTDQSALLSFKDHITFNTQGVLSKNWSTATSACNWIGVTCGSRHKRVTALDISGMGLRGTIPPQLGNLSFLVSLDISLNGFNDSLPEELANLHRLESINFRDNEFSGGVPQWIGALPELRFLYLDNNRFTGTIPPTISNISKIRSQHNLNVLGMEGNQLTGPIPLTIFNISSLQIIDFTLNELSGNLPHDICHRLPKLKVLYLGKNKLYGQIPTSFNECPELEILSLAYNKFSGPIPKEIFMNSTALIGLFLGGNNLEGFLPQETSNLPSLEFLAIEGAGLSGSIPPSIFNNTSLKFIYLFENNLRGVIPATIFNISTLQNLSLMANDLSGNLPSTIGHTLPNLESLLLGQNELSGIVPDSLSNASKLTGLDLSLNRFSGRFPNSLGNLEQLRRLNLGGNNLSIEFSSTGEMGFLSSFTNCKHLRQLWISKNPLNGGILPVSIGNFSTYLEDFFANDCGIIGGIPNQIGNLSNLAFLELAGNDLTGIVPSTIRSLQKLQVLRLHTNRIKGSIPNDVCHLPNLGLLFLSINELSGSIPPCLGNISSLRYLYLDSNNLTSNIPTNLWNLKDLLVFNSSSNSLNGHLPPEIGKLLTASTIDLSMNQFTGDIPGTIGLLESLQYLQLRHNRFEGSIPESFGGIVSLEFMDLSQNNLSGVIPKSLEALLHLKYFNVSFNELTGEIPSRGPFVNFTKQSFLHNQGLCGALQLQLTPCATNTTLRRSSKTKRVLLLYVLLPIASTLLALIFTIMFIRNRSSRRKFPIQNDWLPSITRERITYHELLRATNGFNDSNLLGTGSFGSVYKGTLLDGMIVAVKVFNLQQEGAFRSFDTECEMLRNIRHRNLTKVINSCSNLDFKALVLEYMPSGNLDKWLYSHNSFLDILQRLDIMIDVACALEYLHHGYSTPVVHCDLKPNNILLDENMVAHVSDFGISKFLGEEESIVQTKTLATFGYIAPEYGLEGIVSTRCDVYSYGILLMETFTRTTPTDEMFAGDLSLKGWVNESLPNAILEIIDANLLRPPAEERNSTTKLQCVSAIMELALNCCAELPQDRINMKDALVALKRIRCQFLKNQQGT